MTTPARKKRVWTCAEFAKHAYDDDSPQACRRARRFLIKLNAKHGGALFLPSTGTVREYHFYPATLARLEADLFTAVESLEFRVDACEEAIDEMKANERDIVAQIRQNSRDIVKMRTPRNRAA